MGKYTDEISVDQALNMLPNKETIHILRQGTDSIIHEDITKEQIVKLIKKNGAFLAGIQAIHCGCKFATCDEQGEIFVVTKGDRK